MDQHFLQDVFEVACEKLKRTGKGPFPASAVEAAVRAAASEVTANRLTAMENAVKANFKTLAEVVAENGAGGLPRVDFNYGRITRHAADEAIGNDDPRWKR